MQEMQRELMELWEEKADIREGDASDGSWNSRGKGVDEKKSIV
jgi:hypothetical protein